VEACEYAERGKCGDGRFLPSAGELFQVGQEFAARAAAAIPRLSKPEFQNDELTRQRIIAGFKKLLEDLRSGNKIDPVTATREVFHPMESCDLTQIRAQALDPSIFPSRLSDEALASGTEEDR
jgi:hypothetical protein